MRWNSIASKLGGTIIVLFLVVLLTLGYVIDQIFAGFINQKVLKEAEELSARYASMMESHGPVMIDMMGMMSELSNAGIYIVDAKGKVISSTGQLKEFESLLVTDNDLIVLGDGRSIQKELRTSPESRYLVSAKPLKEGNMFSGGVFILSPLDELDQSIERARYFIVLSGLGALLLAVGITFIISKKMSHPLVQIEHAARRMATGDLDSRVAVTSKDEIGSLSHAINDLAKELQRYRANRSEFFANISHELRTPLTYLEGYARVLSDGLYETEDEKRQYLDVLKQEATRLKYMIQDLFDLSKMEEGKISFELDWIDLTEVIDSSIEKVSLKAREKNIDIVTDLECDVPLLYADGMRMEQIMLNLLDNSIRYTESGVIKVKLIVIANKLHIVITDTGIGIPEEDLPYIFERFYRVEKSRSRKHGGTGLGLAIVKNLVEFQGGSITVKSKVGTGTEFQIIFPVDMLSSRGG